MLPNHSNSNFSFCLYAAVISHMWLETCDCCLLPFCCATLRRIWPVFSIILPPNTIHTQDSKMHCKIMNCTHRTREQSLILLPNKNRRLINRKCYCKEANVLSHSHVQSRNSPYDQWVKSTAIYISLQVLLKH